MSKVGIIGAGAWGTTLSLLLAEKGHEVILWVYEKELVPEIIKYRENKKFLPGFSLPESIKITFETKDLKDLEIYFFVVPTQFLRSVAKKFAKVINFSSLVVSASKGIEDKTLKFPLEILKEELKNENLLVLSGPNLSKEIASGLPAATVVASIDEILALEIQRVLTSARFRVYTNRDVVGVQLGGALKNVIAIAAGIVDGKKCHCYCRRNC